MTGRQGGVGQHRIISDPPLIEPLVELYGEAQITAMLWAHYSHY
jgi:hypothetical protein